MTTVRFRGQNMAVIFKTEMVGRMAKFGFEAVEQISCAILGEDQRVYATGYAFRSPKDNPDLYYGMELAFGRALQRLTADKQERARFWDAFFDCIEADKKTEVGEVPDPFICFDIETPSLREQLYGGR